jgi:hypothetical protein
VSRATGAYLLSGHDGPFAVERFTCTGSDGRWSWTATREEPGTGAALGRLEVHLDGSEVRVHAEAAGWVLRAAATGGQVVWRRGDEERSAAADGCTGSSPAHLLVAAARAADGPVRLRLVEVTEPVLATREVLQDWSAAQHEVRDGVAVVGHRCTDPATGAGGQVWLAAGVVLSAPGARLLSLTLS